MSIDLRAKWLKDLDRLDSDVTGGYGGGGEQYIPIENQHLRAEEKYLFTKHIYDIMVQHIYPLSFFSERNRTAFYLGCMCYRESEKAPLDNYTSVRDLIPEDLGMDTFILRLKNEEKFTWVKRHVCDNSVRVICGFIDYKTPLIKALQVEIAGLRRLEPLNWTYSAKRKAWFTSLLRPVVVRVLEVLAIRGILQSDAMQRVEAGPEVIAESIKNGEPLVDEPRIFGIKFSQYEQFEEIKGHITTC